MGGSSTGERLAVGVMTGTSIDGIDAALVRILGEGLDMRAELVRHMAGSLGDLRQPLQRAASQVPMAAGEFARLAWDFGKLHAEVIDRLLTDSHRADLICVHGQTVFHTPPVSWQLVNLAPIAERFKCPVVFDLRQADLAAGGQGAPITPIADWILFRNSHKRRAIVNLGGFCNVTILPQQAFDLNEIRGFDVCACNQLLDAIARDALGAAFDEGGRAAAAGRPSQQAADELRTLLDQQRRSARSLGTGDEAIAWVGRNRKAIAGPDLAASAVSAIAATIADAVGEHHVDELILAGGGARNRALVARLTEMSNVPTMLSDDLGVPIEAREAMCFAVLGALCADGVPITLPRVTGCREPAPISGVWCRPHGPAQ